MQSFRKTKKGIQQAVLIILLIVSFGNLHAQNVTEQRESKATWIWYPGDYEIWLNNQMENQRTDRGSFFPVFWKMDNHYLLMDFHKTYTLKKPEKVHVYAEGKYNVKLDGKLFEGTPSTITVPAGKHKINIKVYSLATVPAIFVKGNTIVSDTSWLLTLLGGLKWMEGKVPTPHGNIEL